MTLSHGMLHAKIGKFFLERGAAPTIAQLSEQLGHDRTTVAAALQALAAYHGVVLHPGSGEIWVMHPFSSAPTSFWVESDRGRWWGNCAWCSLGIVALLGTDATITTTLGGESEQVVLRIQDGEVVPSTYCVHFPIPMACAWDNVIFTCSTMLVFASPEAVDRWCDRHALPRGDVQPVSKVWAFAQAWYGRHLDPEWTKWTTDEARTIFARFGLEGPIWALPSTEERF